MSPIPFIVDLADRPSTDVDVTLMWSRRSGRVWVDVTSRRNGHVARIFAAPARALDVFNHPFAHVEEEFSCI
jgi:hypothetical protein